MNLETLQNLWRPPQRSRAADEEDCWTAFAQFLTLSKWYLATSKLRPSSVEYWWKHSNVPVVCYLCFLFDWADQIIIINNYFINTTSLTSFNSFCRFAACVGRISLNRLIPLNLFTLWLTPWFTMSLIFSKRCRLKYINTYRILFLTPEFNYADISVDFLVCL